MMLCFFNGSSSLQQGQLTQMFERRSATSRSACLLKMFKQQDKDVVFMETVISLSKQQTHCMVECIPVPRQISNEAQLSIAILIAENNFVLLCLTFLWNSFYLLQAIEEAGEKWAQYEQQKLIETTGNLQRVIPEKFAYFHVEFGLDRGYVHAIEDEIKFSDGFGFNVIRGLLRLPVQDMHRRRRHESIDRQKRAVYRFGKDWANLDWTKHLE